MNNLSLRLFMVAALLCGVFFLINCGGGAKTETNTATTTSGDSIGVPECDEYVKKYEACLTSIASKAPQAQAPLKSAFEQQRKSLKDAAANPQSKATLPATCKQAMEASKQATAAYSCSW